jgi:hypothetical protein
MNPDLYGSPCNRPHETRPTTMKEAADRFKADVRHVASLMTDAELRTTTGRNLTSLTFVQNIFKEELSRRAEKAVWIATASYVERKALVRLASQEQSSEIDLDYPNDTAFALRKAVEEVAGYPVEEVGKMADCTLYRPVKQD